MTSAIYFISVGGFGHSRLDLKHVKREILEIAPRTLTFDAHSPNRSMYISILLNSVKAKC